MLAWQIRIGWAAPDRSRPGLRCLVIATACENPAEHDLAGHSSWSASLLARVLTASGRVAAISARSVQRILLAAAIKPHRVAYRKQPIDPDFEAKMAPIIDLYLHPPADGPVICADEKSCASDYTPSVASVESAS